MVVEKESKYRHELKYLVSSAQLRVLEIRAKSLMQVDNHAGDAGVYNIRSVYFDDYRDRCYFDNENGVDHRAKYRIRIYNQSSDRISLELKRKDNGKTLKSSCLLSKEQADMFIRGKCLDDYFNQERLVQGLTTDMLVNRMKPVIIVEYDRKPYVYKDGNVRVTFDTNISSSNALDDFWDRTIPKRPILPCGLQLLEVKFDEYLPDIIQQGLQLEGLQQTAFSKYYLCRKFTL